MGIKLTVSQIQNIFDSCDGDSDPIMDAFWTLIDVAIENEIKK